MKKIRMLSIKDKELYAINESVLSGSKYRVPIHDSLSFYLGDESRVKITKKGLKTIVDYYKKNAIEYAEWTSHKLMRIRDSSEDINSEQTQGFLVSLFSQMQSVATHIKTGCYFTGSPLTYYIHLRDVINDFDEKTEVAIVTIEDEY